jgi:hypothetical protein
MGRYLYQISGKDGVTEASLKILLAMRKLLRLTLPLLLLLFGSRGVMAQTNVSGTIASNTVWTVGNGPYIVTGDILVASGATLTLEPGLTVRFDPGTRIAVEGVLDATGSTTDSLFFISNAASPVPGSWFGITVSGSVGGFAEFDYCRIQHAATAVSMTSSGSGTQIVLRNTLLRRNVQAVANLSGNQEVRRCTFDRNTVAVGSSTISLSRCAFSGNDRGVSASATDIDSCTFSSQLVAAVGNSSGRIAHSLFVYNNIAIENHSASSLDSIRACQFAENDTALVMAASLPTFLDNEFCANGVHIKVATASNISIGSNCWCESDTNLIAASIIDGNSQSGLGILNYGAVGTGCSAIGQVWPGDTDDDGTARVRDLLHIGVANGVSGYPREGAMAGWLGQAGLPWDQSFGTGLNYKHADCDGNGVVNMADTAAILLNYGQTHQKTQGHINTGGIPLYIEVPANAAAGDTIELNLRLGTPTYLATDVYGIALSLQMDPTVFNTASASGSLQGTWLGQPGLDLIDLEVNDGKFNWAITRDDHRDSTGNGRLGGVFVVMIDDLNSMVPLDSLLEPFDVSMVDKNGNPLPIDVFIVPVYPGAKPGLSVSPNPSNERLVILLDTLQAEEAAIYDANGQRMWQVEGDLQGNLVVQTDRFAPGIYFVRVRVHNGLLTQKVIITR